MIKNNLNKINQIDDNLPIYYKNKLKKMKD